MKNTAVKIKTVADLARALVPDVVLRVPIDLIEPDPGQPRTEFPEVSLRELADDIQRRGVEHAITVRSDGERILIKHGERRWRAAGLAQLKEVPVLLAGPDDDKTPDLERAFDQVLDNHLPEKLSPMDWARFLRKLVDVHKMPVKDIPGELEKRGITMSRPYVSNLMRLVELPEWAAQLLNQGLINASDAKHILMAKPWPAAMKELEKNLTKDAANLDDGEKLEMSEWGVRRAYRETAIHLSEYGTNAPLFRWQTSCKACPKRQQVEGDNFCLDKKCFEEKQVTARAKQKEKPDARDTSRKAAKPKKPAGPTKINPKKIDADGVVHVGALSSDKYQFLDSHGTRFEPAMHCHGCEFNKLAIQYKEDAPRPCCFNVPHYNELQRQGGREEGVAQWLDKRVLPEVLAKLPGDHELHFQIIAWMALGAPVQNADGAHVREELRQQQGTVRRHSGMTTPAAIIHIYKEGALDTEAIAAAGVRAMLADRGNFYAFARHLGIEITPAIASLDQEYLDLKRKPELLALLVRRTITNAEQAGAITLTTTAQIDTEALGKKKLKEIQAVCLLPEIVAQIGVPPDVQALFERLEPTVDPEDDDVVEDPLDEEEDGESEPDPLDTEMTYLDEVDTGEDTNVEATS